MLNSVSIVNERCVFPIVSLSLLVSISKTTSIYSLQGSKFVHGFFIDICENTPLLLSHDLILPVK